MATKAYKALAEAKVNVQIIDQRKLPRQVDSSKLELVSVF